MTVRVPDLQGAAGLPMPVEVPALPVRVTGRVPGPVKREPAPAARLRTGHPRRVLREASPRSLLLRGHAQAGVQADDLAIEVGVLDDLAGEQRELARVAEARRER